MYRSAMAYIVTLNGTERPPLIARCIVEETPDGCRILLDDGSGARWFPRQGVGTVTETDETLDLDYRQATGQLGESGLHLEPVTVDGWNALAEIRTEMLPVFDFDDLAERMKGF